MDPMTMLEDHGRSKGCRGRKSLLLPLAPCTVCAALRMVGGRPSVATQRPLKSKRLLRNNTFSCNGRGAIISENFSGEQDSGSCHLQPLVLTLVNMLHFMAVQKRANRAHLDTAVLRKGCLQGGPQLASENLNFGGTPSLP